MLKRILKYFLAFVTAAFMLLIFYFLFGGAICNDIKANHIKKSFYSLTMPADTKLVEVSAFVGNTSGTGNHTEIWAGMLIYSSLSEDDIHKCFSDYDIYTVPADLTNMTYNQPYMPFKALKDKAFGDGYYVISKYYDAFTQMDLRGH